MLSKLKVYLTTLFIVFLTKIRRPYVLICLIQEHKSTNGFIFGTFKVDVFKPGYIKNSEVVNRLIGQTNNDVDWKTPLTAGLTVGQEFVYKLGSERKVPVIVKAGNSKFAAMV